MDYSLASIVVENAVLSGLMLIAAVVFAIAILLGSRS